MFLSPIKCRLLGTTAGSGNLSRGLLSYLRQSWPPVIVEDDETSTLSLEAAAISAPADGSIDSIAGLDKENGPLSQEAWYDVEYGCYVLEDRPLAPPEGDGLTPMPAQEDGLTPRLAQDYCQLPGLSQDATNQHDDGNTRRTSGEAGADTLPQPSDEDGECKGGENVSELEKDMLLAFEEQENLSLTNTPNSPHPHHPSSEPAHPQMDHEPDQNGTNFARLEELRQGRTQAEECEPQRQEVAVDAMRNVTDDDGEPLRGEQEDEQRQNSVEELGNNIHHSMGSGRSRDANAQGSEDKDDDDEEPRPAKRRKRDLVHPTLAHQTPATPPDNALEALHSATAPLTTQLEDNSTQRGADPGNLPTPAEVERHISRSSRSPSATRESVPLAEYQEWPFQGFLKRTRIGNETTYNLEFKLPCISECLNLPIEACDDVDVSQGSSIFQDLYFSVAASDKGQVGVRR
jgi:hypothetical protein